MIEIIVTCPECGNKTPANIEPIESGIVKEIKNDCSLKNNCAHCGTQFKTQTIVEVY